MSYAERMSHVRVQDLDGTVPGGYIGAIFQAAESITSEADAEIATLRAENERLREEVKGDTFKREYQQVPGSARFSPQQLPDSMQEVTRKDPLAHAVFTQSIQEGLGYVETLETLVCEMAKRDEFRQNKLVEAIKAAPQRFPTPFC